MKKRGSSEITTVIGPKRKTDQIRFKSLTLTLLGNSLNTH